MNRQSWTYVSISLGVIVLWIFFLFFPYVQKKNDISQKTIETENRLVDFKRTIDMLPEIIEKRKSLQKEKFSLDSKLYTKAEVLSLFKELKIKAALKNLEVTEITPSVEELLYLNKIVPDSTQPQFLNIGLNLSGDFINFGKFINTLEEEEYFRGINRCIIAGKLEEDNEITMFIGFKALLSRTEG
ncbi:hypothetical protein ACFLQG_01420 [Candidatus Zixiibacteriota bacterium]